MFQADDKWIDNRGRENRVFLFEVLPNAWSRRGLSVSLSPEEMPRCTCEGLFGGGVLR